MTFPVNPMPRVRWQAQSTDMLKSWLATNAPRKPWDTFIRKMFQPKPGEHVGIIGATGQGKTVLQNNIVKHYPFVVVFGTKPADRNLDSLVDNAGYIKMQRWAGLNPLDTPRRVLWPNARELDSTDTQQRVFDHALNAIFREGGRPKDDPVGWAVAIDELWYFTNMLQLGKSVKLYLLQGRSLGISLIAATQRPAWIPVEVYSQSTHLFFFSDTDEANLRRIGEINHGEKQMIRLAVSSLEQHQVLYVNTRTKKMARTRAPAPVES